MQRQKTHKRTPEPPRSPLLMLCQYSEFKACFDIIAERHTCFSYFKLILFNWGIVYKKNPNDKNKLIIDEKKLQ